MFEHPLEALLDHVWDDTAPPRDKTLGRKVMSHVICCDNFVLSLCLFKEQSLSCEIWGAVYLGQNRLRPRPFFYLGQFYLGQVQLRPILVCPFDHPKCQDEKKGKMEEKKGREKETKGRGRPKAGDAPHEGLLKVERRGVRV